MDKIEYAVMEAVSSGWNPTHNLTAELRKYDPKDIDITMQNLRMEGRI